MQGTYIRSDGDKIGILQLQWQWQHCRYKDRVDKARARGKIGVAVGELRHLEVVLNCFVGVEESLGILELVELEKHAASDRRC
jgi:hypothetical protein